MLDCELLDELKALSRPASEIARTPGIYFLFKDNELVYVGQSNCCENRIRHHKDSAGLDFDAYTFLRVEGTQKHRMVIERDLLLVFRPSLNAKDNVFRFNKQFSPLIVTNVM